MEPSLLSLAHEHHPSASAKICHHWPLLKLHTSASCASRSRRLQQGRSSSTKMDMLQVSLQFHLTNRTFRERLTLLQRLARFLDRPLFPWKKLIVGFSLAQYLFEGFLSLRQYQVLKQTKPPKVLQSEVTQEVFDKSQVRLQSKLGPVVHSS